MAGDSTCEDAARERFIKYRKIVQYCKIRVGHFTLVIFSV